MWYLIGGALLLLWAMFGQELSWSSVKSGWEWLTKRAATTTVVNPTVAVNPTMVDHVLDLEALLRLENRAARRKDPPSIAAVKTLYEHFFHGEGDHASQAPVAPVAIATSTTEVKQ